MGQSWSISRREFLISAGILGGAAATGVGLWDLEGRRLTTASLPASSATRSAGRGGSGPLVVVTMYGGNDGLNTLVPYSQSAYAAARPTLGYTAGQVLPLDDDFGLNPRLKGLQSLWKSGQLAIVRGVGYPNPNLSHFASMDIWQTANPTDGTGPGWIGRWLDLTGDDPMRAISVGPTLPTLLRGASQTATAVVSPQIDLPGDQQFQQAFAAMQTQGSDRQGALAAVAGAGTDLLHAQEQLDALKATATAGEGGSGGVDGVTATDIAGQLAAVAALINAGSPTKVYHVSLSSFDTHSDEKTDQERILGQLDTALTDFLSAVAGSAPGRETVLMTYSEFGRRPTQNASGGTDHGTASVLFVAGHQVKGGQYYGEQPSLTSLDANGNLVYNVDFRSVYSTVLESVVGFDSKDVLGGSFPPLGFV
jgi:uncharacterized protein (DUF1501 family)